MKYFTLFVLLIASTSALSARVGDTEAELIQRFGAPLARESDRLYAEGRSIEMGVELRFRQEDWNIMCDLVDGRCARSHYTKAGTWSEEHIRTVLTANAQGELWEEISKLGLKSMQRQWKRADGALATWQLGIGTTVVTPAYERAKTVAEAKLRAASKKVPKL